MAITKEILDELLKDYQKPEDLLGQSGLLQQLSKALIERGLDGEMTHHLGYEKHSLCVTSLKLCQRLRI
jgi:putative transposase